VRSAAVRGSIVLSAVLVAANAVAQADEPLLISGYDDVLRQANNTSVLRAAIRTMSKDVTYAGMSELYRVLAGDASATPSFFIVSATSSGFEDRAQQFLRDEKYPEARVYFRNWITELSIRKFKLTKIREILDAHAERKFIAVFDNSDASVELAAMLPQQFPGRFTAIYLRTTVKRDLPAGAIGFVTAFEIAAHELQAGRMTSEQFGLVTRAMLDETVHEHLVPSYAQCPRDYDPCTGLSDSIERECADVRAKIAAVCSARAKEAEQ
jgi:phosphatidate phosphatase APP1